MFELELRIIRQHSHGTVSVDIENLRFKGANVRLFENLVLPLKNVTTLNLA
jgi:hypothetical protein